MLAGVCSTVCLVWYRAIQPSQAGLALDQSDSPTGQSDSGVMTEHTSGVTLGVGPRRVALSMGLHIARERALMQSAHRSHSYATS